MAYDTYGDFIPNTRLRGFGSRLQRKGLGEMGPTNQATLREADIYRGALERAAYGDAGRQYGAGLAQLGNFLAGAGPLADSGASNVLRRKLASQIYGQAQGQIQGSYADYLRQALQQRQQFRYQQQLEKQRQKAQKTGLGGTLGGLAGAFVPGLGGTLGGLFGGGGGNWTGGAAWEP